MPEKNAAVNQHGQREHDYDENFQRFKEFLHFSIDLSG
jgi:hypothetical protein